MKLPWDKNYIKISFHVVVTVIVIYAIKLCVDLVAYMVTNIDKMYAWVNNVFGWLFSVCATLVIAFVLSYVLDPAVDFFQNKYDIISNRYFLPYIKKNKKIKEFIIKSRVKKRNKNKKEKIVCKKRTAGTVITFMIIIAVIYFAISSLLERINGGNNGDFVENVISFIKNSFSDFSRIYENLEEFTKEHGIYGYVEGHINSITKELTLFVSNIGNGIVDFIYSFGSGFLNIVIGFVIAFYFMRDKESIKYKFSEISHAFLPDRFYRTLKNVLSDIDAVFSGYIRGQVIDASIMSVLIGVGLSIVNVDFAIIIGIVSGFANIIPYFGAVIAFVLAMIVTLLSGEPIKALYAAIIIIILQQLDGIVIGPKVVGENVKLSPVMIIIALAVASEIFGIWGMILAVPVVATIKIFAQRFYYRQKMKKNSAFKESEI